MNNIKLGKIISVNGTVATAKMYKILPPYINVKGEMIKTPSINSLVGVNHGVDIIICKVFGEWQKEEVEEKDEENFNIGLNVIGSFDRTKNVFELGIRFLPFINAEVFLLDDGILEKIHTEKEPSITMGMNIFDEQFPVMIPINKLYSSHIGIFGNTGSGKSFTLSKLIYEFNSNISDENVYSIMFDFTGEYVDSKIFDDNVVIYNFNIEKITNNKFPFDFEKLNIELWYSMLKPADTTQLPLLKYSHNETLNIMGYEPVEIENNVTKSILKICLIIKNTLNMEMYKTFKNTFGDYFKELFDYFKIKMNFGNVKLEIDNKLIDDIDNSRFEDECKTRIEKDFSSKSEEFCGNFLKLFLFNTLKNAILDGMKTSYFLPLINRFRNNVELFNKTFCETNASYLNNFLNIFKDKKNAILDLSECSFDRATICRMISEWIFKDFQLFKNNEKEKKFISIIIDECHNVLNDEFNSFKNKYDYYDIFEKISKEGRKFNVFLYLASQRPSEINQTILSQLHNVIVHRLSNETDINKIKYSNSFLEENYIKMISYLGTGECLVTGIAAKQVNFCKVDIDNLREKLPKTSNYEFKLKQDMVKKDE